MFSLYFQAILSQFSWTKKAKKPTDGETDDNDHMEPDVQGVDEDDEDNVNLEEDTQDNDEGAGGGDKDEDDEIDPAVDASNVEMIEKVLKEIAEEGQLSPLTDEEVQLGQYSIAKVGSVDHCLYLTDKLIDLTCSSAIWGRKYSTVWFWRLTSRWHAL